MILLLGARGYIGQAFAAELTRRQSPFVPLSRAALDYTTFDSLFAYVRKHKPSFIINAAGSTGGPNIDACESARKEMLAGNVTFPHTVGRVCLLTGTPWGHVSSGCIYSGAGVLVNGAAQIERDLSQPWLLDLFESQPERFHGFTELDEPNCTFHSPPCSFYSGTKALAEEALREFPQCHIWRLRIPFDEFDHPRNFLTKVRHSAKILNGVNSMSHRGDFVRACLDLWEGGAPCGIYNVTNSGAITTRQVVEEMHRMFGSHHGLELRKGDGNREISETCERGVGTADHESFADTRGCAPPNCILDTTKLLSTGVKMRPVQEAITDALERWQPTSETLRMLAGLSEQKDEAEEVMVR
jgi:dTDP-4-dehydrorhamnose reductase